jgi:hypothetical protein
VRAYLGPDLPQRDRVDVAGSSGVRGRRRRAPIADSKASSSNAGRSMLEANVSPIRPTEMRSRARASPKFLEPVCQLPGHAVELRAEGRELVVPPDQDRRGEIAAAL